MVSLHLAVISQTRLNVILLTIASGLKSLFVLNQFISAMVLVVGTVKLLLFVPIILLLQQNASLSICFVLLWNMRIVMLLFVIGMNQIKLALLSLIPAPIQLMSRNALPKRSASFNVEVRKDVKTISFASIFLLLNVMDKLVAN